MAETDVDAALSAFFQFPKGKIPGKPSLKNLNDVACEAARIYRIFRNGKLCRDDYRDAMYGLKVLKEIFKEKTLAELAQEIEALKAKANLNGGIQENADTSQPDSQ
ncbi:MAG: hypothetical protein GC179_30715 [Anaerolineaceae bacterium]|nr:hypothetical protein [Anaerolineaceae bacterium]